MGIEANQSEDETLDLTPEEQFLSMIEDSGDTTTPNGDELENKDEIQEEDLETPDDELEDEEESELEDEEESDELEDDELEPEEYLEFEYEDNQ